MGAVADLPMPSTGAVAELPMPNATAEGNPDVEATVATQGSIRRGLRASVNSLGASMNALLAGSGAAMGLTQFADERFKEAEDYANFADAVGPRVRDFRAVKDLQDTVDFVEGIAGEGIGGLAPAGVAGAVTGLRGAAAVMGAQEMGNQLLRTKDAPASPQKKLAAAGLEAAVSTAAGLAVPVGAVRRIAGKQVAGGLARETAQAAGTMGAMGGAQEAARQHAHNIVDPERDKSDDIGQMENAAIGGTILGAPFGAAPALISRAGEPLAASRKAFADKLGKGKDLPTDRGQTADEAKGALDVKERPSPLDPDPSALPDHPDAIGEALDQHDAKVDKQLESWWKRVGDEKEFKKFDGWQQDLEKRDAFHEALTKHYGEIEDRPLAKGLVEGFQNFVSKLKGKDEGKSSERKTALDMDVYDLTVRNLPEHIRNSLSPAQRDQLASDLKSYVLHTAGRKEELPGPGAPETTTKRDMRAAMSEDGAPKTGEGQRPQQRVVPHQLMDMFGDQLHAVVGEVQKSLMKGGIKFENPIKKGEIQKAERRRGERYSRLEETVLSHLRPEVRDDPATRQTVIKEMTSRLRRAVTEGVDNWKNFDAQLDYAFGERKEAVLEAFDGERENITRVHEDLGEPRTDADTAAKLKRNEQFRVTEEDEGAPGPVTEPEPNPTGEQGSAAEQAHPYRDVRLGVPIEESQLKHVVAGIKAEAQFDPKQVRLRFEPEVDEQGNMTGRQIIHAEDAEAPVGFNREELERIKDQHGKAGLENSVVSIVRKGEGDRNETHAISIPRLVAETARTMKPRGRSPESYMHDLVMEGLSRLMSDPDLVRFAKSSEKAGWNFPDDMFVGRLRGEPYTWGQIKKQGLSKAELQVQRATSDMVQRAMHAPKAADIREHMLPFMEKVRARYEEDGNKSALKRMDDAMEKIERELERREKGGKDGPEDYPVEDTNREKGIIDTARDISERQDLAERQNPTPRSPTLEDQRAVGKGDIGSPSKDLNAQFKSRKGEKDSLRDTQADKLFQQIKEQDGREFQNLRNRIEKSGNEQALRDTIEFLDDRAKLEAANGGLELPEKVERRIEVLRDAADARLYDLDKMKGLDITKIADDKPVWAAVDEQGNVVGVYKDHGYAQMKAEEIGGSAVNDLMKNLRGKYKAPDGLPKFSDVRMGIEPITEAQKSVVTSEVKRLLGDKAEVLFKAMDTAGKFFNASGQEMVAVSLHALDPLGAGRHEAFHGIFARMMATGKDAGNTLSNAASSPTVLAQLRKLLKDEPRALAQLKDREERAAYMYEFWAAGQLKVGPETGTIFEKVRAGMGKALHALFGIGEDISTQQKAERLLQAFHAGELAERSTASQVLDRLVPKDQLHGTWQARMGDWANRVWSTADGYIRDQKIPAFTEVADKFHNPSEGGAGLMQTKGPLFNQYMNRYSVAVRGLDDAAVSRVLRSLQTGEDATTNRAEKAAVGAVRGMLDDLFDYMKEKGVKVVEWSDEAHRYEEHDLNKVENFFPRAYDREVIAERWADFVALLEKHGVSNPEAVAQKLVTPNKASPEETDHTLGLTYYAPNTMARKLSIPDAELAPFMKKDLGAIMYDYLKYTTRRGEYASRFGNQGQKIEQAIKQAEAQGASPEQVRDFGKYVKAMEGSLGSQMDPKLRKFMGAVLTYQNWRLLPLALFSSLIDPLGIWVRGGQAHEAFGGFARGIRELVSNKDDAAREFARTIGSINEATEDHMVADMYGLNYASGWQKWLNDKLFKLNGMESWNNSMRISAATAAKNFIVRHAEGVNKHSERYLRELGLEKSDVRKDANGELDLTPAITDALNKWVDGAILRPHAGIRPIWASDPHFMLVAHLKQFTYSFQKTINERVAHEALHGNYTPLMVLASYVPFIIASDYIRAQLTPGQGDDDRYAGWGLKEYVGHGLARAGITGPGQWAIDSFTDMNRGIGKSIGDIGGPTVQQAIDLMQAAAGAQGTNFQREAFRSLPLAPALFPGKFDREVVED